MMAEPNGCPECGEKWFNCACKAKHRKRRGGKKPYTIEYRCKPDSAGHRLFGDDWIVWKRYETEARRDTAMKALTSCEAHFEHRKGET